MVFDDRYGQDVLAGFSGKNSPKKRPQRRKIPAETGVVVEETGSGFCGAIIRVEARTVELEDALGHRRSFPLGPGFLFEGEPVILAMPVRQPMLPLRSASGSMLVTDHSARVARKNRIFVEGTHDAELVEKIWGHDLRVEGVVVECLEGVDHLVDIIEQLSPHQDFRIGVLVDHLVPGSKEQRIAEKVQNGPFGDFVAIVGHPFIDIWQAVKPQRVGLQAWPSIPRETEWKYGVCQALGWPTQDQADIAQAWKRILGSVRSYADLEPALLGRVEELIDFVTEPV